MRRKQHGRLAAIAEAALAVFSHHGFAAAQVGDIARAAGVSVGTLYLYAASKQALFELAIGFALDDKSGLERIDLAGLPLVPRGMAAAAGLIDQAIGRRARWPLLTAQLRGAGGDIAGVVGELYDAMARERPIIWLLDRCARELPALRAVLVERVRGRYVADLARYVRRLAPQRRHRPGEAEALARATVEMVAWMAMHRLRDLEPQRPDATLARAACIAMACGGLRGRLPPLKRRGTGRAAAPRRGRGTGPSAARRDVPPPPAGPADSRW